MKTSWARQVILASGLILITISGPIFAESASDSDEPLVIRGIMQQLGKEMQNVTAAISSEDWPQVEKSAAWIADHPRPPMTERMRIMGFMGSDAGKFKAGDKETHEAARELMAAAETKDGQAVISVFSKLQSTCLGCHQNFRESFKKHFYGQD